ncbi:MAG TPA: hypothetical protein PLZ31_10065 [Myxococcota bacterium]|nr:hypothetical protein [Myxococcota bacterium]HPB51554.1 hypothetical protein [Myxococcota bacterium]
MATAQQNPGDILHDLGRLVTALGEYRTVAVLTQKQWSGVAEVVGMI